MLVLQFITSALALTAIGWGFGYLVAPVAPPYGT